MMDGPAACWADVAREAARRLEASGVQDAQRDANLLLADALGLDRAQMIARERDAPDVAGLAAFEARIARRAAGEPVSRIRGWREFRSLRFEVTADVLDPRPETELLVEAGLARLPDGGRVLDLGTGSGCILVSILSARADVTGHGVDASPAALAVAQRNADRLGVADRACFVEASWDWRPDVQVDLVLSNPPYVTTRDMAGLAREVRDHDPELALHGGADGLEPYRAILAALPLTLKPGCWLGVEFGAGQAAMVNALMVDAGLEDIGVLHDLAGHARAAFGRRPIQPLKSRLLSPGNAWRKRLSRPG